MKITCALCGVEFTRPPSKLKCSKSGLYFCTRRCKDRAQKIGGIEAIMPSHYGTGSSTRAYRSKALALLPNRCNRCGYDRYVEILEIHHSDRDRDNNNISNLEILCPNCHAIEHL